MGVTNHLLTGMILQVGVKEAPARLDCAAPAEVKAPENGVLEKIVAEVNAAASCFGTSCRRVTTWGKMINGGG